MRRIKERLFCFALLIFATSSFAYAQSSIFTYQGRVTDGGPPGNGPYDIRFKLFDDPAAGTQIGTTITATAIQPLLGTFSVQLDFGVAAFTGADRFIELSVSPAGQNNFTTLTPRQRLTSSPHAIQSLKAADSSNLGGVAANQYVVTGDIRLSDARNPLPGSSNYVQNTNTPQAGVNFSIGGTGTANILNATTRFDLGGNPILSNAGMDNMFVGVGAGASNTGARNAFFGHMAGPSNTSGVSNTFFGTFAGTANTIGNGNSFFGRNAGSANIVGSNNTFIGNDSNFNSANPTGLNNTLLGAFAQVSTGVNFSTAIGESSQVTQSNSIVLGKPTTKVGIGTSAPQVKLHVKGASEGIRIEGQAIGIENGAYLSFGDAAGTALGYVGDGSGGDNSMYLTSYVGNVNLYTPVGAVLTASSTGNVTVLGGPAQPFTTALQVFDNNNGPYKGIIARSIFIDAIPGNGFDTFLASPVHVCARIEALGAGFGGYVLVRCTAARTPKSNEAGVQPFSGGIDIIRRLNPLSFRSKADGPRDVGLNAEDVAAVEPSLVTRTENGDVEDVKEGALDLVFINAFKEQQEQIKTQQEQINKQQQVIDALKKLACSADPLADLCRGGN